MNVNSGSRRVIFPHASGARSASTCEGEALPAQGTMLMSVIALR